MITISSRSSPLAIWQSEYVSQLIRNHLQQPCNILPCVTEGDKRLMTSLAWQGGKGLFLKELQNALLQGSADIAVHSMKDVPVENSDQFTITAILQRADPFDVVISKHYNQLQDLPSGAIVGTASLRRRSQILHRYPHLSCKLLRGNINTRIRKALSENEYDAIILAKAGIERLQLQQHIKQTLPIDVCLPAIGQGAIGIECLRNNHRIISLLKCLDHEETRLCVSAERQFNQMLSGNCHSPIACYATMNKTQQSILIHAVVASPDGKLKINKKIQGSVKQHLELAQKLAQQMIDDGALAILSDIQQDS